MIVTFDVIISVSQTPSMAVLQGPQIYQYVIKINFSFSAAPLCSTQYVMNYTEVYFEVYLLETQTYLIFQLRSGRAPEFLLVSS